MNARNPIERDSTTVPITIDGRNLQVEVEEPGPLERTFLVLQLPPAVATGDPLTMQETMIVARKIVAATTSIPHEWLDQLPAATIERLADAAVRVMADDDGPDLEGVPQGDRIGEMVDHVSGD